MQCSCPILSPVACLNVSYFSTLSHKRHEFLLKKKVTEHKMFLIFSRIFYWNISHSKQKWERYDQNCTGLFEMIVGVLATCRHLLQMQHHVIYFYGVTSRIRFMFLLFPQVSRNWRYESEPPLKPSPLKCYKQFGTNSIIVLMFVESQRVHI